MLAWYRKQGRALPWRRTRDPYRILVSEVMLQQTQVDRVVPYYQAWFRRWPTVHALARARRSAVIRAWSGLGYNRRAVNLHRAAQVIMNQYRGRFPTTIVDLETLPGVGAYTARAIAAFAFKQRVAFIDTNVRRVLGRVLLGKPFPGVADDVVLLPQLHKRVPPRTPDLWHHALMDLGATVCLPRPRCAVCPLRRVCRAYPGVLHARRPRRKPSAAFRDSDRYWRGRIIRFLSQMGRQGETRSSLAWHLRPLVSPRRVRLLSALVRDGLIVKRHGRYRLPT